MAVPDAAPALAPARALRAADYERARTVVDGWFGHPVGLVMHRLFFDQLGPSGVWLEDVTGAPAGFLLGLVSEAEPDLAYVHMHVVDPRRRGTGAGDLLYREFCARAHARGCRRVRALAAPARTASRRFHERLGFTGTAAPGYMGEGGDRIVYERALPLAPPSSDHREQRMSDRAQDDRRAHPRVDVDVPARVHAAGPGVDVRAVNISEGGILLAGTGFPSVDQVRVEIELAELGWHEFDAQVVRREGAGGGERLAARFARVATGGGREAIREFLLQRGG